MPKSLKDLFLDRDYNVPIIEPPKSVYKNDIVNANVIESEANKKGVLLQFAKNLPKIYGTDLVRIESRGSIDPARTIAVDSARAVNTKGGGFGRLISNLLGTGDAHRPSDTIFKKGDLSPVSKNGQPINSDWSGLKYAVEDGGEYKDIALQALNYKAPSELDKFFNGLAKGNNPQEMAQQAIGKAIGATQNLVTKGLTAGLTIVRNNKVKKLKKNNVTGNLEIQKTDNGNFFDYKHKSQDYIKFYDSTNQTGLPENKLRTDVGIYSFDTIKNEILNNNSFDDSKLKDFVSNYQKTGLTYLNFRRKKMDGTVENIILPAAIDGEIVENINSEWNDFKYVGSPFKNYRYNGVEREIKLSFKVYWLDLQQKGLMESRINKLRSLCFPDEKLADVELGDNLHKPLVFTPTTVKFSIPGYYENLNVILTGMSISVPQHISWASDNPDWKNDKSNIYPTVVNISVDMKIIESHILSNGSKQITYKFDKLPLIQTNIDSPLNQNPEIKYYDGQ